MDWNFCDQILYGIAILDKMLKTSIFKFFSVLIFLFSKIFSALTFHTDVAFQKYQIYLSFSKIRKVIVVLKISAMNKQ